MNVVSIIAEYNPMHNGHIYNIKRARELANADYVIVIMSGSFTEQGNIACINKFDRATIAIENGADMVIELPTVYATSSAENFAFGAVNILNSLGIVTHLAFGAETQDIHMLKTVANIYLNNKNEIIQDIKKYTKQGINSGDAYTKSLNKFLSDIPKDLMLPNNILAIEYLKALIALNSQIEPVLVHRQASCHSDAEISNFSEFASSTSIRNVLADNNLSKKEKTEKIRNVVPTNTLNYLTTNNYNITENLWNILKYEITKLTPLGLKDIYEVTEGLENKLYKQALKCDNYNEFIFSIKSKRYTLSKIKRICIYIILGITKEKINRLKNVNYARILKVKESSLKLLSELSAKAHNTVITKITDEILYSLEPIICESIKLDILSHNLFNESNLDYINKIIQP